MQMTRVRGSLGYTGSMPRKSREKRPPIQLSLAFVAEPPPPGAEGPILTRALLQHPSRQRIMRMVRFVLRYFPELEGTFLKIGIARGAQGYASLEEPQIWLNPRGLCYQTIAHEFVHLLQARGLVPMGERSCDIFSLARDRLLVDAAPVYLEIPAAFVTPKGDLVEGGGRVIHLTAREAVQRRQAGHRQYIRWFEKRLEQIAEAGGREAARIL